MSTDAVERPAAAPAQPALVRRLAAELLGTFWLVLGGCGTAVLAGKEVGYLGVALAFGLTVVTGAYAFGPISGGHFNPAVSVGLATAKRFDWRDVPAYVGAQVVGGVIAAAVLFAIASGKDGFDVKTGFATNGYGSASPDGYSLAAVLLVEVVLTAVFLLVILGVSAKRAAVGFSGLAIGLALTLIHLISIPVSNTSVNPARSIAVAVFAGGDALSQIWVFILAPVVGAAIAGVAHVLLFDED
ncbi:aquaporin Z [Nocardioides sp. TRM66260-LWL]|uniref:aquaporin Z n=1 Tax=Nocardioides sp. TRM66260-LWL TaxID=2874478 RepID=UPI001CC7F7FD|nr:aquaporin Z [Nocardioides sp. TRM66260-LWL]MBZ5736117.1 aquaporin Z [Nocardioides sp. TRM66260-LWL]